MNIDDCCCHGSKSIPFLDTKLYIEDGKITTDLYIKPTDRCYMYYTSGQNLVICSKPELRDAKFSKLKDFFLRDYNSLIVDCAIVRAKAIYLEKLL